MKFRVRKEVVKELLEEKKMRLELKVVDIFPTYVSLLPVLSFDGKVMMELESPFKVSSNSYLTLDMDIPFKIG